MNNSTSETFPRQVTRNTASRLFIIMSSRQKFNLINMYLSHQPLKNPTKFQAILVQKPHLIIFSSNQESVAKVLFEDCDRDNFCIVLVNKWCSRRSLFLPAVSMCILYRSGRNVHESMSIDSYIHKLTSFGSNSRAQRSIRQSPIICQ